MDAEAAIHGVGETLVRLQELLIAWGALDAEALGGRALDAARMALHDQGAYGSVIYLVRAARRTASSMRERLSADFWSLLVSLENGLASPAKDVVSEADALAQVEAALPDPRRAVGPCPGEHEPGGRLAVFWTWADGSSAGSTSAASRAHSPARTPPRTISTCCSTWPTARSPIGPAYLVGLAKTPVRDMVLLDPFNTRSLAFQVVTLQDHLAALPSLVDDGMLEAPRRILVVLATEVETADAAAMTEDRALGFENALLGLSGAIADRYFLQGANAVPTVKLGGLA